MSIFSEIPFRSFLLSFSSFELLPLVSKRTDSLFVSSRHLPVLIGSYYLPGKPPITFSMRSVILLNNTSNISQYRVILDAFLFLQGQGTRRVSQTSCSPIYSKPSSSNKKLDTMGLVSYINVRTASSLFFRQSQFIIEDNISSEPLISLFFPRPLSCWQAPYDRSHDNRRSGVELKPDNDPFQYHHLTRSPNKTAFFRFACISPVIGVTQYNIMLQ